MPQIAATAPFVDGRSPTPTTPQEPAAPDRRLRTSANAPPRGRATRARNFVFRWSSLPRETLLSSGMAMARIPTRPICSFRSFIRSDIASHDFLNPPNYEAAPLPRPLGDASCASIPPGAAILYPSDTLHESNRHQGRTAGRDHLHPSRGQDPFRRNLLYDLNEVAALEGLNMAPENFTRMQLVQSQLLRHWGDRP